MVCTKYSVKAIFSIKTKQKEELRTQTVVMYLHVAVGVHAYRRTIERRAAASVKKVERRKQYKTEQTSNQRKTTRHPSGGYEFAPLVANQLWRANQYEPACFGLSTP